MLRLHGSCGHVLDARISDLILVDAREVIPGDGDGRTRRVVGLVRRGDPGVRVEPLAMTDATRCLDAVQFDDVALAERDVVARGKDADTLLTALVNRASVAVAADSVGIARRVVNMTASYANQRKQFGRLIGSFQAVKHQAADMLVDTETSDGLVDDAVRKVGEDPTSPESTLAASMAKSHACEKAAHSVGVALQLHGGIGYTWEHDLHLFLKRATLNEQLFGSTRWHRDRVATQILTSRST
jgi:alkylation response protein AidB-like acyl-CoA dehydrogenase